MLHERNGQMYLVDRGELARRRRKTVLWAIVLVGLVAGLWLWLGDDGDGEEEPDQRAIPGDESSQRDGVAASAEANGPGPEEVELSDGSTTTDEPPRRESTRYVIKPGDLLGNIASAYGCDLDALRSVNRIKNDMIYPGDELILPGSACDKGATNGGGGQTTAAAPTARQGPPWYQVGVDSKSLESAMRKRGFKPPAKFKAFVLEISFDPTRKVITRERAWDWSGSSDDIHGWNPASTVKLFAAIAALQHINGIGFDSRATVRFGGDQGYTTRIDELIQEAVTKSDNVAYNRTVQLAGFDYIHGQFLKRNRLRATALLKPYAPTAWKKAGGTGSLRDRPKISLEEDGKKETLPKGRGETTVDCHGSACTTLQDLAEVMRRLMLQEQLPSADHFHLEQRDLIMLRQAMRAERSRGNNMVDALGESFTDPGVKFYSKPGFAGDWFSDNVYIFDPTERQRAWIVTMAAYPGRSSLDGAAKVLGQLIKSGELEALSHSP